MKHTCRERGFIALMSAVIISAVLLLIATGLGLSGFYSRSDQLDSELKERSAALAESCADEALLRLAGNPGFRSTTTIAVGEDRCLMGKFAASGSDVVFETQASSSDYFSNLKIIYDPNVRAVVSWQEIPTF